MNVVSLFNMSIVVGILVGVEDLGRIIQLALSFLFLVPITFALFLLQQLCCVHCFMEVME